MDKKKRIEEMAQCKNEYGFICCDCVYRKSCERYSLAEELYNAGYRKQVEYWEDETKVARRDIDEAVKDTAQEALEAFICKLVNSRLVSTKDDLYVEMLETKDDLLKEKYGVEVE